MKHKSYMKIYWLVWLAALSFYLWLRFAVYSAAGEEFWYHLNTLYMMPSWLAVMVTGAVEGRRLRTYLENNHYDKWVYLTSVPFFNITGGGANSSRMIKFIWSRELDEDPNIKFLKKDARGFISLTLCIFFSYPFVFIGSMLPWNEILAR